MLRRSLTAYIKQDSSPGSSTARVSATLEYFPPSPPLHYTSYSVIISFPRSNNTALILLYLSHFYVTSSSFPQKTCIVSLTSQHEALHTTRLTATEGKGLFKSALQQGEEKKINHSTAQVHFMTPCIPPAPSSLQQAPSESFCPFMPGFPEPCCLLCQIAIIAIHSWSTLFFTPWALYGFPIPISASCLSSAWPRASSLMAPRISVPTSCSTTPSYLLLPSLPQSSRVPFLFAVPCLSMPSL